MKKKLILVPYEKPNTGTLSLLVNFLKGDSGNFNEFENWIIFQQVNSKIVVAIAIGIEDKSTIEVDFMEKYKWDIAIIPTKNNVIPKEINDYAIRNSIEIEYGKKNNNEIREALNLSLRIQEILNELEYESIRNFSVEPKDVRYVVTRKTRICDNNFEYNFIPIEGEIYRTYEEAKNRMNELNQISIRKP